MWFTKQYLSAISDFTKCFKKEFFLRPYEPFYFVMTTCSYLRAVRHSQSAFTYSG